MAELTEARRPIAMTIAGSDSGAGAGVQADLKTFVAMGVYGASVLTAITAQNTMQVTAVHEVPVEIIAAQIQAVLSDMGANAVKTGMLSSSNIIATVAEELKAAGVERLVVDPVMVAKSGDSLLRADAVDALCGLLLPLATVVTPNIPEAEVLTGTSIESRDDARQAAKAIHHMGPPHRGRERRTPDGRSDRPLLRRRWFSRVARPTHRHEEHSWHRVHLRLSHRCGPRQGIGAVGFSGPSQDLHHRGHPARLSRGPRPRPGQPLLPLGMRSDATARFVSGVLCRPTGKPEQHLPSVARSARTPTTKRGLTSTTSERCRTSSPSSAAACCPCAIQGGSRLRSRTPRGWRSAPAYYQ